MRQDPLLAGIGGMLQKFKRAEAWLRKAGLPTVFARVPIWLLCIHYCVMMKRKTVRISRIGQKIARWLDTITALSRHDKAKIELIDIDHGMRNDIESTKRTLLQLRELCVDVGTLFGTIGFHSRILDHTQRTFLDVVDHCCATATTLQRALALHDERALALLRQVHEREHTPAATTQAHSASEVHAEVAGHGTGHDTGHDAGQRCDVTGFAPDESVQAVGIACLHAATVPEPLLVRAIAARAAAHGNRQAAPQGAFAATGQIVAMPSGTRPTARAEAVPEQPTREHLTREHLIPEHLMPERSTPEQPAPFELAPRQSMSQQPTSCVLVGGNMVRGESVRGKSERRGSERRGSGHAESALGESARADRGRGDSARYEPACHGAAYDELAQRTVKPSRR